jgi:hypothetical protein
MPIMGASYLVLSNGIIISLIGGNNVFLGITMGSILRTTWVPNLTKNVRTIKPKM